MKTWRGRHKPKVANAMSYLDMVKTGAVSRHPNNVYNTYASVVIRLVIAIDYMEYHDALLQTFVILTHDGYTALTQACRGRTSSLS